ncbi:hypothetical protein BDM02DRAFT_1285593 [Thelephora ganbajun]|uniref:Uncharacterized protein n=1 Tax=Thelephora ganbajun TaxID=370292 RepID=A0ACB6ZMJ6_THEGA|nr:hypothetical protein BDM02DRAFT_1285593 [Thelephora ganbajun]
MTGKERGKSKRESEDATEASSTAVELNPIGTGPPTIEVSDLPEQPPNPDTGTPLPDDPNVLKENVKGLKNQLRRHKQQVLPFCPSTTHRVYAAIVRR